MNWTNNEKILQVFRVVEIWNNVSINWTDGDKFMYNEQTKEEFSKSEEMIGRKFASRKDIEGKETSRHQVWESARVRHAPFFYPPLFFFSSLSHILMYTHIFSPVMVHRHFPSPTHSISTFYLRVPPFKFPLFSIAEQICPRNPPILSLFLNYRFGEKGRNRISFLSIRFFTQINFISYLILLSFLSIQFFAEQFSNE